MLGKIGFWLQSEDWGRAKHCFQPAGQVCLSQGSAPALSEEKETPCPMKAKSVQSLVCSGLVTFYSDERLLIGKKSVRVY